MQLIFSPTFVYIYLFCVILLIFLTIAEGLMSRALKKRKRQIVKETYPNLSKKDLKFREISLYNYHWIYADHSFNPYIVLFLAIASFFLFAEGVKFLIIDYSSGLFFCAGLCMLFLSGISLLSPNYKKSRIFWENYLKEQPDNPLKVILFPIENDLKLIRFLKISAFYRVLCGLYSLFFAYALYQFNL